MDGLWSAQFRLEPSGAAIHGSGVVVFTEGRLMGGDSNYYYIGSYEYTEERTVILNLTVHHYSGEFNNIIGNGVQSYALRLSGNFDRHEIVFNGATDNDKYLSVTLERLS